MTVAGVRIGTARHEGAGRHWDGSGAPVSWADAKADALALLQALGVPAASVQVSRDVPDWFHPGQSAVIQLGPRNRLGCFGAVHPLVARKLGVALPAVAFEINLKALPERRRKGTQRPPLEISDLQPVTRDFAFELDRDVPAGDVLNAARGADKKLIAGANIFDVYEGENVGAGRKSLALEVRLQPRDKTLTDDEIDAVSAKIVAAVKKATGGVIRK